MPKNPPRQTMLPRQNPRPPPTAAPAPQGRSANTKTDTRVLLVVEEGDDAVTCRQLLEREGLKVVAATSHQAGLQVARREQPQLVVVDASLPDRGARELALA